MKKSFFLGLAALFLGACVYKPPSITIAPTATQTATPTQAEIEVPKRKTVTLVSENNSGQSGTALIEDVEGKVKVTLALSGTKVQGAQPAHIHIGVCPGVGAVKYPLSNVVNGKSVTMLTVSMVDLVTGGPMAINIHKSNAEPNVYVACGGI